MVIADLPPATLVTIRVSRHHPHMVICALERANTPDRVALWNGASWQAQAFQPSNKGSLAGQALSCRATAPCMAVGWVSGQGGLSFTLAEQWNGHTWQIRNRRTPAERTG
jgi:hypothetical protein